MKQEKEKRREQNEEKRRRQKGGKGSQSQRKRAGEAEGRRLAEAWKGTGGKAVGTLLTRRKKGWKEVWGGG